MLMKMIQSGRVKCAKSTYNEYITSTITPYHLIGKTQRIKEYFCYCNKTCKIFTLDGLRDRIFFLMNKFRILSGKSYFWYELSDFWDFMKTDEETHPLHSMVMTIFQGEINPNRTLYAGFCSYVNERLCPVGAILMYLFLS